MTISLSTRGILCGSSPTIGRLSWGVLCNPLTLPYIPFFEVGESPPDCNNVFFNKNVLLLATPTQIALTTPSLNLLAPKKADGYNKGGAQFVGTTPDLVEVDELPIYNKDDPNLIDKDPDLAGPSDDAPVFNKEDADLLPTCSDEGDED